MILLWLALLFTVNCWKGSVATTSCLNTSFARVAVAYQESATIVADEVLNRTLAVLGDPSTPKESKTKAAYEKTLKVLGHQDTPENEASFHEAITVITTGFYDACYGPGNVSLRDFPHLKQMFETAFRDEASSELQSVFGAIMCLKSKSTSASRRKRQQPSSPCGQSNDINFFYNCISADAVLLSRIFVFNVGGEFSLAFVIDDSGSMGDEIERVKCLVKGFVKAERNSPTRYILGTFNYPNDPAETKFYAPQIYDSSDVNRMTQFLQDLKSIKAAGGGGDNEPGISGLIRVVDTINTQSNSEVSAVILFTDENPQMPNLKATALERIGRNPHGIEVFFFLDPRLPRTVSTECLRRAALLPDLSERLLAEYQCRRQCVEDYVDIARETMGFVTDSIAQQDVLSEFASRYNSINPGVIGDLMCNTASRRRRAITSCVRLPISVFATAFTVVIETNVGSVSVADPHGNTLKTVTSIEVFTQLNPEVGIWSVCPQGTGSDFTFERSIRNDFQFTVQFLMVLNGVVSILPSPSPPGCNVTILTLTQQLRNLTNKKVQSLAVTNLAGEVIQVVNLERCHDHFLAEFLVPQSNFSFRFRGVTLSGIAFESAQTLYYEPEQPRLVVTEVYTPQQISKSSSAKYRFIVATDNNGPCSIGIRIDAQVVTADPEVNLSLSSPEVTISSGANVTFHIDVYVGPGALSGQNQIELSFYATGTTRLLKKIYSPLGVETPGCPCQHGGSCFPLVRRGRTFIICQCASGYAGPECEIPICTHVCQNGGTCSAPDSCTCTSGWTGITCSDAVCAQGCQNGGTCSAPDSCTCASGWTGQTCDKAICTQVCQNGGTCSAPDSCTCTSGWTGSTCSEAMCTQGCQNGGTCSAPDSCICVSGWTGQSCAEAVCSETCQNGGTCSSPDTCSCVRGWAGNTCSKAICIQVCQNGGTCSAPDSCTCTSGWTGKTCSEAVCTQRCQNGGTCSAPDSCICVSGWTGQSCEEAICTHVCQNGGTCSAPDSCTCTSGWTGNTCSEAICSETCQNGGICSSPDTCSCAHGWTGNTCSEAVCSEICLNGGTCSSPDTCSCAHGWTGNTCSEAICTQVCQNGGTCSAPDSCTCTSGWTGSTCSEAICSETCQNGGTCSAPDVCSCASGWTGRLCGQAICSEACQNGGNCSAPDTCSCASGWTGNTCSEECKTQRADVAFVVDSSRSIKQKDYKELQGILAAMVADLNIGPDAVQVGVIQFGRDAVREFGLTNYTTRDELKQAIIGMERIKGKSGTNIPDAVKAGVDLLRENGRNVTKWLVLFTDGRSTIRPRQQTLQEAANYATTGDVVNIAVGFGSRLQKDLTRSLQELRMIAQGKHEHVFLQPDIAAVAELRGRIVGNIQC